MKNCIFVTFVMPIFNASKYLNESIASIFAQKNPNWRLICIDDGSSDNSCDIVENYIDKDKRVLLMKQKNAGPAVARARAIQKAETEYIAIIDADDKLDDNYVGKMLEYAERYGGADIVTPNVKYIYEDDTKHKPYFRFDDCKLYDGLVIEDGMDGFALTIPWRLHGWQMIKTSFAKKYYIESLVDYSKLNSDEFITRYLYLKSSRTVCCDALYLHRCDNPDSLTRTVKLLNFDCLITLDKLIDLCKQEKVKESIVVELYNLCYVTLQNMIRSICFLSKEDQNKAKKLVEDFYVNSYRAKFPLCLILRNAPIRTIVKFVLSMCGIAFFKKVFVR